MGGGVGKGIGTSWRLTTNRLASRMFENSFNNIDRAMRNDEGLASELDYAEQTSWLLFLKYLDDLESERQDEAALEGRDYTPILDGVSGHRQKMPRANWITTRRRRART